MTARSADGHDGVAVAATLFAREAADRPWQTVIVGAGPAGAATALGLARAGVAVLLVDREPMPRGKVCGCCLSMAALAELDRLGLWRDLSAALRCVPLVAAVVAAGGRTARVPLPGGAVVSREALDAALVRAAIDAGAHWLPGLHVQAVRDAGAEPGVVVEAAVSPETPLVLQADFVVVAAGLADHVRIGPDGPRRVRRTAPGSRIGVGTTLDAAAADVPAGELLMAVGRVGYCGVVRLEDGRIDVAAAVDRAALRRGHSPAEAVGRLLRDAVPGRAGIADRLLAAAAWRATPALTHETPLVASPSGRILRVGDAAGYVEPFTGEGIGWALAAARILVRSLTVGTKAGTLRDSGAAARDFARDHARHFGPRHGRCRRVASGLRVPVVVRGVLGAARLAPWAARRILPAVVGAAAGRRAAP